MPVTDVFMSSPPRPHNLDPALVFSSSPNLPSLDEIFTRSPSKPLVGYGNRAAPILANTCTPFTSAAALLRDAPEIDIETEQITDSPPRKSKDNRVRKEALAAETPIVIESPSPKDKPWQKFKSKKPISEDKQPPGLENGVDKPKPKRPARAKPETVSRHFTTKEEDVRSQDKGQHKTNNDCGVRQQGIEPTKSASEPAMARRNDWTPPRATSHATFGSDLETRELLSSLDETAASKDVFQTLFDTYGRNGTTKPGELGQQPQLEGLNKRKHVELLPIANDDDQQPRRASPLKAVAAKKKARTITELATARYILPEQPELDIAGPSTEDSLLNYFDSDGALKGLVEHQTTVMSLKKDKAKPAKGPAKSKRKKKPGTGTENNPILLSPNSALKQSSNQDFVFGTSSQLVREESPTTLRELQMAIRVSNQVDSDPFADSDSQGLWHASARDIDGDLMDIEVFNPEPSPAMIRKSLEDDASLGNTFVDIEDILTSPAAADINSNTVQPESEASLRPQTNTTALPSETGHKAAPDNVPEIPKPKYELFTDIQLARQITSYGFKPVKKRQAMVALLDQCWASKNQGSSLTHSKPISTSAPAQSPPKKQPAATSTSAQTAKPRGRPKKNADTSSTEGTIPSKPRSPKKTRSPPKKAPSSPKKEAQSPPEKARSPPKKARSPPKKTISKTIEIADSDTEELNSLSPASSPDGIFSSPPPLDLSDMTLAMSPDDQQDQLFKHINKAVTSTPRSEDPLNPSWHEKMLLFDPVVIEDLTSWLNGGELTRVGYDGEVCPLEVKKWCESRSVICLWKQTSRGLERKRY